MSAPTPNTSVPLPRGVQRALQTMGADFARDWRVSELAAAVGVSTRTLQRQFRHFRRKGLLSELADIRFGHARRMLLRGRADTKVVDVALRCGVAHFGRFALEYRRRYGETPSDTLRRQASLNDRLDAAPFFFAPNREGPTVVLRPIETDRECIDIASDVAEQVATALMRAGISVAKPSSSARYHLTGAIRGAPGHSRIVLRLVETETGRHLWAHHASNPLGAELGFEEQIATKIVASMQPQLRQAEIDRSWQRPDGELTPTDLALRAMPGVLSLDAAGNARALELLERAMDKDPDHALATALAAWAYAQRVVYHFSNTPLADHVHSASLAHKALTLSPDATLLAILGTAFTLLHNTETAAQVVHKALSIDGGSAWAWSRSAWIDVYNGDAEAAIDQFKIALDLAPHDTLAFNNLVGIGCAHFKMGRYLDAARWQQRALTEHPSATWVHRTLCPAYVMLGAEGDALSSLRALRQNYPDLTISQIQRGLPPLPLSYRELVVDALSSLGLPA